MKLALCALALTSLISLAQGPARPAGGVPSPVRWQVAQSGPATPETGAIFGALVEAKVTPGWHLYAMEEPEDGPVALQFSTPAEGLAALVSVSADRPVRGVSAGTFAATKFYLGEARFQLRLRWRLVGDIRPVPVSLTVRYQACNDRLCLPPRTETLPLAVNVDGR